MLIARVLVVQLYRLSPVDSHTVALTHKIIRHFHYILQCILQHANVLRVLSKICNIVIVLIESKV